MDDDGNLTGRDVLKAVFIAFAICGVILFFFKMELDRQEAHGKVMDVKYWKYVADHNCVRTGFAGKRATPVYQCDNGLWLSHELMQFANPKEE